MAALPFFVRLRKLKTAKWAKKVHSQFHPKFFGCQPKNIFSFLGYRYESLPGIGIGMSSSIGIGMVVSVEHYLQTLYLT